jgi:hypothetical protein
VLARVELFLQRAQIPALVLSGPMRTVDAALPGMIGDDPGLPIAQVPSPIP